MRVTQKINAFLNANRYNLIFLISLVMFNILYLLFGFSYHHIFEETDGFSCFLYFKDIINNNIPPYHSEYWPAGLPLLIGGLSTIIGDFFIAGKIVIVEFSILFLISVYVLIKKIFNEKIAFFTYFLIAMNNWTVSFFYTINSDIAFSSLALLSVYFLISNSSIKSKSNIIYSSIFIGLATMIRWTGLFFIPIFFLNILIDNIKISNMVGISTKKKNYMQTRLKQYYNKISRSLFDTFIFMGIFLLIVAPIIILNVYWNGTPFFNKQYDNVYRAIQLYNNVSWEHITIPDELSWGWIFFGSESNIFYQQVIYSFIYEFPKLITKFLFAATPIYSILSNNLFLIISYLVFSFIFIGYYFKFRKEKKILKNNAASKILIIPLLIFFYLLIISMGFARMRFLYPIIPLLIAPLIYLIIEFLKSLIDLIIKIMLKIKRFKKTSEKYLTEEKTSILIYIIITTPIIFQFIFTLDNVKSDNMSELIEFKIAGVYLQDKVQPDDILIARKFNYLYYIGKGRIQGIPGYNLSEFYLGIQSVNFVIICERLEAKKLPFLKSLLDPSYPSIPAFLKCIFFYNQTGRRITIYEII